MDFTKMRWGVDVNGYHPVKDWAKFAASGARFFGAKATEGAHTVDATFERHRDGFRAHAESFDLAVWYHFFHCEKDPGAQAELLAATVGTLGPKERLCCDFEEKGYSKVEPAALLAHGIGWLETFFARLDALGILAGTRPMIYTSARHWIALGNHVWQRAASIDLWTARYFPREVREPDKLPRPWPTWAVLQYTDGNNGPHRDVPGVGLCDCDVLADGFPR